MGISNSNSLSKKGLNTSLGKILSCLLSPLHGLVIFLKKLDLFALCLAQRRKRKRLLGGNPICFFLLFLVVLMIVTTVATSLYLYFSSFVPSLASDCKKVQKLVLAVQKQIMSP